MKKTMIRVALLALAALLALSLVACGDDGDYKQFSVDEQLSTITDGTTTYKQYSLPLGFYRGPVLSETAVCCYKNTVTLYGSPVTLYESGGDSGILYCESYYTDFDSFYFATDAAEAELQAFFGGEYHNFALARGTNGNERILVSETQKNIVVTGYMTSPETRLFDVTTIDQNNCWFPLVAKDKTGTFSTDIGALLLVDNACYFIDFSTLDNSRFDANGYFSFRSGNVSGRRMTGDAARVVSDLLTRISTELDRAPILAEGTTPESIAAEAENEEQASIVLFWALYIGAGFVLPGAGLAVGLIFATRQKPHAHRWFIVVGIAGLWLLISCVVLLLILV